MRRSFRSSNSSSKKKRTLSRKRGDLMEVAALLRRLIGGEDMTPDQSAELIGAIMDGDISSVQGAGLLVALAAKGERIEEVAGAARAMRERSVRVNHGMPIVVD